MAGGRHPMSEPLTRQDLLDLSQCLAVRAYFRDRSGDMEFYLRSASTQQFLIDQSERWVRESGTGPPVGQHTFGIALPGGGVRYGSGGMRPVETRDPL